MLKNLSNSYLCTADDPDAVDADGLLPQKPKY